MQDEKDGKIEVAGIETVEDVGMMTDHHVGKETCLKIGEVVGEEIEVMEEQGNRGRRAKRLHLRRRSRLQT